MLIDRLNYRIVNYRKAESGKIPKRKIFTVGLEHSNLSR